jgi:hypothetical protein
MNELPRINNLTPVLTVNSHSQVAPAHRIDDKTTSVPDYDRRSQDDRRKRNKKPVVERRVSSDRRGHRFDAKA